MERGVFPLKKLSQFMHFDIDRFLEDKAIQVTEVKPWEDFDHKGKVLGTVVEVVILEDKTVYDTKDGEMVSNRYEKFKIKVPQRSVAVVVGDFVAPVNPTATVFGEHRNQLSVKADNIVVIDHT